jgi:hypothetical protein
MTLYIEETLLHAVKKLLSGPVNELLEEAEYPIPLIECSPLYGGGAMTPVIRLAACERTEKERLIRLDAYSLTITFAIPEGPEAERSCYAYAGAAARALQADPALGGAADRAVLTGKKYTPPNHAGTGEDWEVTLSLRITVEGER